MVGMLDEASESQFTVSVCGLIVTRTRTDDEVLLLAGALHWREAIQLSHRHRPILSVLLFPADIHFYTFLINAIFMCCLIVTLINVELEPINCIDVKCDIRERRSSCVTKRENTVCRRKAVGLTVAFVFLSMFCEYQAP